MSKAGFLYIMFFLNILLMIHTMMIISKKEGFTGMKKTTLIYLTIFFPVLGYAYLKMEPQRIRINKR